MTRWQQRFSEQILFSGILFPFSHRTGSMLYYFGTVVCLFESHAHATSPEAASPSQQFSLFSALNAFYKKIFFMTGVYCRFHFFVNHIKNKKLRYSLVLKWT